MTRVDPFRRAGWYGFAIVALLLLVLPVACHFTQADESQPDGQAADAVCLNGWCVVRQDTLREIVVALNVLDGKERELRALCGW